MEAAPRPALASPALQRVVRLLVLRLEVARGLASLPQAHAEAGRRTEDGGWRKRIKDGSIKRDLCKQRAAGMIALADTAAVLPTDKIINLYLYFMISQTGQTIYLFFLVAEWSNMIYFVYLCPRIMTAPGGWEMVAVC